MFQKGSQMLKNEKKYGLATKAIHAGQEPDKSTGVIMAPIYASSTYVQESPESKGYEHSRTQILLEQRTRNALQT